MQRLFQTVKVEHEVPVEGEVTGDIPDWVNGSLYRNGPGMYEIGEHKYNHMWDALALFQRFHIRNKKVTYQSRYLKSDVYKKNIAAQRIVVGGVGTLPIPDPCHNIFQRFLTRFQPEDKNDNNLVSFYSMHDELYAASETNFIFRVDPDTLDTLEKVDISSFVAVHSASAHPHTDPDGTVHNVGNSFEGGPKTCIIKIPPQVDAEERFPKGEVMSAIRSSAGKMSINYMHSFGMSENYYVYVEQPLIVNLIKILTAKMRGDTKTSAVDFWPNIKARFRILKRSTGEEVNPNFRYEASPFMIFHHINTYEDNGHLVLDVCGFKTKAPLDYIYLSEMTSEECESKWRTIEEPEPRRYVLPLDISDKTPLNTNLIKIPYISATAERLEDNVIHCIWETIAETGFELPQINYGKYNGRKYQYAYGVGWHNTGDHFHTITKIDIETKTFNEWGEDKCYPSEPVFVADPNGTDEDDGVVIAAVNRSDFGPDKHAFLLVLDAKSMKEIARATFNVERFPRDIHGLFKPS